MALIVPTVVSQTAAEKGDFTETCICIKTKSVSKSSVSSHQRIKTTIMHCAFTERVVRRWVRALISKKDWIELLLFKKWSQKIAAAATLLGPKKLLMMSQCEITRYGLSDASLRIFELLGGMHSTCFWFMVYIPPINNKLGPTNMAPMASKTWVLKQ